MRYAVIGYGRSGTHWVSDLMSRMIQLPLIFEIDQWKKNNSILHSNSVWKVIDSAPSPDSLIIFCVRQNSFRATISLLIAQYTNEWYHYTTKSFDPFYVNPEVFIKKVKDHQWSQQSTIQKLQTSDLNYMICEYEKLVASDDRYKYIADLIGFDRGIDHRDVPENPNPRDYSKIITNYSELEKMWRSVQND